MSATIGTTLHGLNLPIDRVPALISGDTSFCKTTKFQRFIDFFRYIFTGNSLHENHQGIFSFINIDDAGILNALGEEENKKWHSVLCMARLIDKTQERYKSNYSIELTKTGDDRNLVNFMYSGSSIVALSFSNDEMAFIEENMFSKNDGKLVDYNSCSCIPLEYHLYEALGVYLTRAEGQGNAYCTNDEKIGDGNEITFQVNGMLPENENVDAVVQEIVCDASSVVDKRPCDAIADIDVFICDKLKGKTLDKIVSEGFKIGSGAYGTAYKIDDFVVKTPVNKYNKEVNFSGYNASSHPNRASKYLNQANDDMNFSRAITVRRTDKGDMSVDILVSRFVKGLNVTDKEREDALDKLYERGLEMYDGDLDGNILKAKYGQYYFVDADQMVISFDGRDKTRKLSQATIDLEEMLLNQYKMAAHTHKGEEDDFYKEELQRVEDMIAAGKPE